MNIQLIAREVQPLITAEAQVAGLPSIRLSIAAVVLDLSIEEAGEVVDSLIAALATVTA